MTGRCHIYDRLLYELTTKIEFCLKEVLLYICLFSESWWL